MVPLLLMTLVSLLWTIQDDIGMLPEMEAVEKWKEPNLQRRPRPKPKPKPKPF